MARPKRRPRAQTTPEGRPVQTLWLVLGLSGLAVLVLIVAGMLSRSQEIPQTAQYAEELPASGKVLGFPEAPVEVWDFSDFHCPHCRTFALGPAQQLIEEYVKPGKVRLVYKHFIVLRSYQAANASECAAEQGKFWAYHDYLFTKQESDAPFTPEELKQYANDLGLDMNAFSQCVDSGKYMDVVLQEMEEGRALGVRGTPTIFVNGQLIPRGALWPDLKAAVEQALQAAETRGGP